MSLNSGETLQPFKALNQLIFDSSGNLIGIQNDRAVGNDLRIGGGSGVDGTFATLIATTALKLNSGATFDLYNTADQTTNYERLRASFISNRAEVGTFYAGTGTPRQLRVGAGTSSVLTSYLGFYSQQFPFIEAVMTNTASSGVLAELFKGTFTGSAGTQTIASIQPTFNQSGTAGYTALDINPTESATGSGTKLLQRWAVGGTAVAQIYSTGLFYSNNIYAYNTFGMSSTLGGTGDVLLNRDTADTLALRRSTNAQNFRVYGTYTDASNFERAEIAWAGNIAYFQTTQLGTGTARQAVFGTTGANSASIRTNSVLRWDFTSAGHFLANNDNTYDIGASGANRPRALYLAGGITHGSATLLTTTTALTNGAAAATGTLTNAPTAGDPTKWIPINDNGTTRYIPAW